MRVLSLGNSAFTVEFASGFDDAARASVVALDAAIQNDCAEGKLEGVVDVAPTFRSLTVHFDPLQVSRAVLEAQVRAMVDTSTAAPKAVKKLWRFPVCYGGEFGPDLAELSEAAGLSEATAIELHSSTEVAVHMLGFLPGFAFMGDIADELRQPRRSEPRLRVPPGSVAVADRLTAIYPWESPGGWHLIGRCPLPFFDQSASPPSLLAPGDRVQFAPVSQEELTQLSTELSTGSKNAQEFCVSE